jgi:hypothetical protein
MLTNLAGSSWVSNAVKPAAKPEQERRGKSPQIKQDEVEPESVEKAKPSVGVGQGRGIRDCGKDNADERPRAEQESGPA